MQHLARKLVIAGIVASFGGGAFAQSPDPATMTCADFMALSADQQMTAMTALRTTNTGSSGAFAAGTTGSSAGAASGGSGRSSGDTSGTMGAGSGAGSNTSGSGAAGSPSGSSGGASSASGGGASADPQIAALMAACQGNETSLVTDRMSSM